jgi:hypothetical protein
MAMVCGLTHIKEKISNLSNIKFVCIAIDQCRKWQLTPISGALSCRLRFALIEDGGACPQPTRSGHTTFPKAAVQERKIEGLREGLFAQSHLTAGLGGFMKQPEYPLLSKVTSLHFLLRTSASRQLPEALRLHSFFRD